MTMTISGPRYVRPRYVPVRRTFDDLTNHERWRCATRLSWLSMDLMGMRAGSLAWQRKLFQVSNMQRYIAGDRELMLSRSND